MSYMKLIKMLYLADRQSLIETGYPITGDRPVSMDRGPVLSRVLDLINWGGSSVWQRFISPSHDYDIDLLEPAGTDELSPYEVEVLHSINERFGGLDRWALVRYTHTLPEWVDPAGAAVEIDPRVILREAGKSDEEIQEIASQVDAIWTFENLYAAAR